MPRKKKEEVVPEEATVEEDQIIAEEEAVVETDEPTDVQIADEEYVKATVAEGASASYTVSIDTAVATGETVEVPVTYSYTSAETGDIVTNTVTDTLDENNQSVNFNVATVDDAYAEGDEVYNVNIGTPVDSGSFENIALGNATVATTITDGADDDTPNEAVDTATVSITGDATAEEAPKAVAEPVVQTAQRCECGGEANEIRNRKGKYIICLDCGLAK